MYDIKEIESLQNIVSSVNLEFNQYRVLNKLIKEKSNILYKKVCDKYSVCPICGNKLVIKKDPVCGDDNNHINIVDTLMCTYDTCEYNKEIILKYKQKHSEAFLHFSKCI